MVTQLVNIGKRNERGAGTRSIPAKEKADLLEKP